LLERLLLERRRPLTAASTDALVDAAVRAIRDARGVVHVGALARELSISRDRLEKRFRHAVGTTPKHLASIHRLRRALQLCRGKPSFSQVALDAGYFDQSHFIREFRAFTGDSPGRFFASVEHC
jgi:methylphosphotriester-DNA--protein-cysteine methyltransferase